MTTDAQTAVTQARTKSWLALHAHYTSNPNPLLADCIGPLIAELRDSGLIDQYFFIRYWIEGPHVRLRLQPSADADEAEIVARAEQRLKEFFAIRPAAYEVDPDEVADMYRSMYLSEYTQDDWDEKYGPDGAMPVQPNNTVLRTTYEPEYDRYGGPHGIDISEWHFEASSDMVIALVARTNMHLRTITFGIATQLMTVMSEVFLRGRDAVIEFLEGYEKFWAQLYVSSDVDWNARYDETVDGMHSRVRERIDAVYEFAAGRVPTAVGFLDSWKTHCEELRRRIVEATDRGLITFGVDEDGRPLVVNDSEQVLRILLGSYLHMNDNRLGVTPNDESYLAHVVYRCLRDSA
jgi:hypothetical protein